MPQSTDIVINGAGYMVEPGSYKRLQDGMAEGRTERISLTDFFGGGRRALQLERDKFFSSQRIGPVLGGQGVRPWGVSSELSNTVMGANPKPDKEAYIPMVIVKDYIYIAIGRYLYKGPAVKYAGSYTWALAFTFANDIVDLCIYSSYGILVTFGDVADILFFNTNTGAAVVLFAGERGYSITAYAGYAAWSDARAASRPTIIRLVTGSGIDTRPLDFDPIAMTVVGAEMVIVTKHALYSYTGRVKEVTAPGGAGTIHEWTGEFAPFFQQGVSTGRDDYRLLESYGGRIMAWIAGGVHEKVPSGDRAGWRSTGLEGRRCYGGCVTAGYLIVTIEAYNGNSEIWAYDGNGWWCLDTKASAATGDWCSPFPLGGTSPSAAFDLGVHQHGVATVSLYRLTEGIRTDGILNVALSGSAHIVTPMIDASERDKPKAWRKIGAVFASPEIYAHPTTLDPVGVYLDYSIDGGETWTEATAKWVAEGNTYPGINFELTAVLSGQVSTFLILRMRWLSVSAWAPILVGLWSEYEVLHNPARRRKWDLKIHARDQEIDRNGVLLTRTGRQLITELWDAWENDTVETFRDLDYDESPVERSVRIVGIGESVAQPSDSADWGDSIITLKLVEV